MKKIIKEISKKVIGNERPSLLLLVSLFANGHILIEDVPGVGKTLLATSISKICNIDFARVQCTSDLLPGDILGFNMFDINTGEANYVKGPVMTNLLLVDEINRATPKTQSALLEVMEEHNISLDGKTFKVPEPFMVIATQNPIENSGTFPLPEAQLDRFTMKISLGYPNFQDEIKMLELYKNPELSPSLDSIISRNSILSVQEQIKTVTVYKTVIEYITNMVVKTRSHPDVALGCSPRSSLALMRCAQSL
ncbi:MAG: AAA family ATPase, partial [Clostridia bacterium]